MPVRIEDIEFLVDGDDVRTGSDHGPVVVQIPLNASQVDAELRNRFERALRSDSRTIIGRIDPARP